jgi:GABA permease
MSSAVGFVAVVANYTAPAEVFSVLMSSTGSIALMVYLVIAFSQLSMRRKLEAAGHTFQLKMWLFPWLTLTVITFIFSVLIIMIIRPEYRIEVGTTSILAIFLIVAGVIRQRSAKNLATTSN